jgi:hypothetical protein
MPSSRRLDEAQHSGPAASIDAIGEQRPRFLRGGLPFRRWMRAGVKIGRGLSQSAAAWVFAFLFHESVAHMELFPCVPIYLNVQVCSIVESNFKAPVEAGTVE